MEEKLASALQKWAGRVPQGPATGEDWRSKLNGPLGHGSGLALQKDGEDRSACKHFGAILMLSLSNASSPAMTGLLPSLPISCFILLSCCISRETPEDLSSKLQNQGLEMLPSKAL